MLIRTFVLTILLLRASSCCFCQLELSICGARADALGGIQSPLKDLWSAFGNQAGLAYTDKLTVGGFYENRFGIKELSIKALVLSFPLKFGTLAVAASHFGYSQYNESLVGLAYGRQLIPNRLALGIKLNFYQLQLGEDYGNYRTATGEIGLLLFPIEKLSIGIHINNPFPQKIASTQHYSLPTAVKLGCAYRFEKYVLLAIEADKALNETNTNLKAGLEFILRKQIFLRAGISSFPATTTFGTGFRWANIKADLAFSRHSVLGISPKASIQYRF